MKRVEHVACTKERKNSYYILVEVKSRQYVGELQEHGKIILKWNLKK
jgi:hypothetical protein